MRFFKKKNNNSEDAEAKDVDKPKVEAESAEATGTGDPKAGGPAPAGPGGGPSLTPKGVVSGVLGVFALLWIVGTVIGFFDSSTSTHVAKNEKIANLANQQETDREDHGAGDSKTESQSSPSGSEKAGAHQAPAASQKAASDSGHGDSSHSAKAASSGAEQGAGEDPHGKAPADSHGAPIKTKASSKASSDSHGASESRGAGGSASKAAEPHSSGTHGAEKSASHGEKPAVHRRPGIATTEAMIKPLEYELEERWWGWRPNDLINVTDNVNYFQLGVLEVTRRASVALADRLARTGSTAAYDPNLETAVNWFMVKADAYWFPSAESKYREGLDELRAYKNRLERGEGQFFTRPDNLIPLLATFEDLLGSCDENLLKTEEDDGTKIGWTRADDYFYYTKGVAHSMLGILEAVHEDFHSMLESRRSAEILHHAIEACHHAAEIDPWLILESDPDGFFANHRLNMAGPISHARFYLGLLIKALST